ncbi:hypothetical protein GmHk_08G023053 [Glycine max]|nr:hypothetical protein GmHk_08G023053 [Glycine max]
MAKIMLKVTVASDAILNTFNAKDQDENLHTILYNQNLDRPTIVAGWTTLRNFYHMTGDHQASLTHYDKSVFFFTIFKSSSHPKSFPRWHSLYHQVPNFVTFNVLLTQHKITCSSLVSNFPIYLPTNLYLPNILSTMYYFLKDKDLTHLNLEDITECQIVFNHWRKTAKIGAG